MISPKAVVMSFRAAEEPRDQYGTPYKEESRVLDRGKVQEFLKSLYPGRTLDTESMPGGWAFYMDFPAGRRMVGNYSFKTHELWYKIYPGTKVPKPFSKKE